MAGLAALASVAWARLAVSASRPKTESLERMAATTPVRPEHASIG
jgi:hypothetical protein